MKELYCRQSGATEEETKQDQYAVVFDGMILDICWAENIIDAGVQFSNKGTLIEQSVILNMTRLLEGEDLEFPDKIIVA